MVRVANMQHLDRGIFVTARKEMLYDGNIFYNFVQWNLKEHKFIHDKDQHTTSVSSA
jgi:hypothetical protein